MKLNSKTIFFAIFIIAVIAGIWYWFSRPKDLDSAIAKILNVNKSQITINFPPCANRYPGTLLCRGSNGTFLPIDYGSKDDCQLGNSFTVSSSLITSAGASLISGTDFLNQVMQAKDEVEIELTLKDGKSIERKISDLKKIIADHPDLSKYFRRKYKPEIITKSYEGIVEVKIKRKNDIDNQAWSNIQSKANGLKFDTASVTISLSGKDAINFSIRDPVVIAFETSTIDIFGDDLSPNTRLKPDNISFSKTMWSNEEGKIIQDISMSKENTYYLNQFELEGESDSILFVPIVSEKYVGIYPPSIRNGLSSANMISQVMKYVGAKMPFPINDESVPLSKKMFNNIVDSAISFARTQQVKAVILYYVGHAYAPTDHDYVFVMGDYEEKKSDEGIIVLDDIYSKLKEELTCPFAVLIDGCFTDEEFKNLKQKLGFTENFDFTGHDQELLGNLGQFSRALYNYGNLTYRDSNPILFAVKPGELAKFREVPTYPYALKVAPLAWKSRRMFEIKLSELEPVNLGNYLKSLVDYSGTGQIDNRGTCSWSNFEIMEKIPFISLMTQ